MAVTVQAKRHGEGFGVVHLIHLIDASMALDATDAPVDMDRVIEEHKIRQPVDLDPGDRLSGCGTFTHEGQPGVVFQNLDMTVHTRAGGGDVQIPGFVLPIVAIPAIQTDLANMQRMGKAHWLNRLVTDASILRCEIVPKASHHSRADQQGTDEDHPRQPIGPFWKNRGHPSYRRLLSVPNMNQAPSCL